jgi:hypothetical protein
MFHAKVAQTMQLPMRLSIYLFAFILCWSVNTVFIVLCYYATDYCSNYWLEIVNMIFLYATGFVNCIVYGFTSKTIRRNYTFYQAVGYP